MVNIICQGECFVVQAESAFSGISYKFYLCMCLYIRPSLDWLLQQWLIIWQLTA